MNRISFIWRQDGDQRREHWIVTLLVRLGINAGALWVASRLISGIVIDGWPSLLGVAAIFGLVNALIRPLTWTVGLPLTCLTLGLFALVINAAMLALTAWFAGLLDLNFTIEGFWAAFWGALLVSVVSTLLSVFVGRPLRRGLGG
jgi:putative membrane protein